MKRAKRYKVLSDILTVTGFLASVILPIYAATDKVTLLLRNAGMSVFDRIGITVSGGVVIILIVVMVSWRFFGNLIKERFRFAGRTLIVFFGVGYAVLLCIKRLISALESIFLGGFVGAFIAVVCYGISDLLKEKAKKQGGST